MRNPIVLGRNTVRRSVQRAARSQLAWRLSGISYPTAILATRGDLKSIKSYLEECHAQVAPLLSEFRIDGKVLEFGCGLGGNLTSVHELIVGGVGLDINRGFIHQARAIAQSVGAQNIEFAAYDGKVLPFNDKIFGGAISLNVFERIPHELGRQYVREMTRATHVGGVVVVFFLSERSRGSRFTRWLGDDAYHFWSADDVKRSLETVPELSLIGKRPWGIPFPHKGAMVYPGDLYIFTRKG